MSPPDAPQAPDRPAAPGALTGLNPVQSDAVTHAEGPLLVVAGAGSGKTRVLTHRIAHLIRDRGVSPFAILAITFTNKAADEMKSRVAALVGPVAEKMWVSTFHSACVRILRRDADLLGYPRQFTIYDEADAVRLTGYVIRDLGLDTKRFPPRSASTPPSRRPRTTASTPRPTRRRPATSSSARSARCSPSTRAGCSRAGSMDFDDLLTNALRLLREHPQTLRHYQERFQHILVDEYQDTNRVQNELVLLLAADHRNIAVVGDQDQCLPPGTPVSTADGPRPIEALRRGRRRHWHRGDRAPCRRIVSVRCTPGQYTGRMYTVHAGGHTLRGTPHHVVLADPALDPGRYVVYLMERIDRGFRLGLTKSVRPVGPGQFEQGIRVRINQEHADRAWVLRVCDTRAEAAYYEAFYAADLRPTDCALPRVGSQPRDGRRSGSPDSSPRSTRGPAPSS